MHWGAANSHWFSKEINSHEGTWLSALEKKHQALADFSQHQHLYSFREAAYSEIDVLQNTAVQYISVLGWTHTINSLLVFLQEKKKLI